MEAPVKFNISRTTGVANSGMRNYSIGSHIRTTSTVSDAEKTSLSEKQSSSGTSASYTEYVNKLLFLFVFISLIY